MSQGEDRRAASLDGGDAALKHPDMTVQLEGSSRGIRRLVCLIGAEVADVYSCTEGWPLPREEDDAAIIVHALEEP